MRPTRWPRRAVWPRRASTRSRCRRAAKGGARMSALSLAILLQAGGHRAGAAVPLSRPLPARHAVGPAGRARDRRPQPAAVHRRSAQARRLLGRHAGLRRRLDRPDQCRRAAQPRARRRRTGHRRGRRRSTSGSSATRRRRGSTRRCGGSSTRSKPGAEFAVTPPIYDLEALDAFLARTAHVRVPLIAAVRPFDSLLHAEFLANEVPNLRVPEALIARMRRADAPGARRRGRRWPSPWRWPRRCAVACRGCRWADRRPRCCGAGRLAGPRADAWRNNCLSGMARKV